MGQSCVAPPGLKARARGFCCDDQGVEVPGRLQPHEYDEPMEQVPKAHRVCHICYVCMPPWGSWEQPGAAAEGRFAAAAPRSPR
mmetsp:Transcript_82380/g.266957  ORF Transcript_82380/g.266957 Transcript_82380/m.266957 type:complete len:84 (+) Transcript_82380:53-304(+)